MCDELVELAARLRSAVAEGRTSADAAERQLGRRAFELLLPADDRRASSGIPARSASAPGADLAGVLRYLAELGDLAGWNPAPEYRSTALAAIDAISSIGVRYGGILNVIARYSAARIEQGADPQVDTPADLVAVIEA